MDQNRKDILDAFHESLLQPFYLIIMQEDYVYDARNKKDKRFNIQEEQKLLNVMIKNAKRIYGKHYKEIYESIIAQDMVE